jgi:hypothetical protein
MRKPVLHRTLGLQFIIVLLIMNVNSSYSQIEKYRNLPEHLFPDFTQSRVKMKVGKDLNILLNYNMVSENMVFFQKDQAFDLVNQESIDTIYMNGCIFIPYDKVFLEVIRGNPFTFFIQHRVRVIPPGKPAGYGGTSETTAATTVSRLYSSSASYDMSLKGELRVNPDIMYWVSIDGKMNHFITDKQLLKLFPDKQESIKKFIKDNKLKVSKREDFIRIAGYCNELAKK